jgi:hypothetical protein
MLCADLDEKNNKKHDFFFAFFEWLCNPRLIPYDKIIVKYCIKGNFIIDEKTINVRNFESFKVIIDLTLS